MKAWQTIFMSDSEYIKIRMASIHPSVAVPFDIYVYINNRHVHYLRTGDHLSADKIENFEKKAPDSFFIRHADRAAYKKFIHQTLNSGKLDPKETAMILEKVPFPWWRSCLRVLMSRAPSKSRVRSSTNLWALWMKNPIRWPT
jgi:hypothetical protein